MKAVASIRRKAGGTRTGHAGTLDPMATGVLVLALGRATKSIESLMNTRKHYRTEIDLSGFSTTEDREGTIEPVQIDEPPRAEDVLEAISGFQGDIMQRPPAFSAIKVKGRRSYQLARSGKPTEHQPRPVIVHSIRMLSYEWPVVRLEIKCGKGFYVRSLARDLGTQLGTGGYCLSIRRLAVGPFDESMALSPGDVPEPVTRQHLLSLEEVAAMLLDQPGS